MRTCVLGMGRVLGVGLSSVAAAPLTQRKHEDDDFEGTPVWVLYVASMTLVLLGGAFAGLTIAYVGVFCLFVFLFHLFYRPVTIDDISNSICELVLLTCFLM